MKIEIIKGDKEFIILQQEGKFNSKIVTTDILSLLRSVCVAFEAEIPEGIKLK